MKDLDRINAKSPGQKHRVGSVRYIPAFYFSFLTPFYDFLMKLAAHESAVKPKLVEQAGIGINHRVLDLGCGTGTLTILLKKAQPKAEIIGFDGDSEILEYARAKITEAGLDIQLDHGMAFELPYPDNSFDRVVASMVFHHLTLKNKARTLKEVFRVLKPGGELLAADFGKPQNILMRLSSLITRNLEETADLIKGFMPRLLYDATFERIEEKARFMTIVGTIVLSKARKPKAI